MESRQETASPGNKAAGALSNDLSLPVFSARKGNGVQRWIVVLCMAAAGLAAGQAQAPEDEAARAKALYTAGKRVDALPLYEDLAKAYPKEWVYQERLADCLGAKATQLSDPVEMSDAGMLDCWILINGADQGIAQDYDAYRKEHRQLLHDYVERFVVHGGVD